MSKTWLIASVVALGLLAGCSSGGQAQSSAPAGSAPTTTTAASATTTAAATTTATPSRLTKDQFTQALKAAGWPVGDEAYTTAVQMCASETPDTDIKHLGEMADPNASDQKLAAYIDAVHRSC